MPWRHDGVAAFADPWFRLLWLVVAAVTARTAARDAGSPGPSSWLARHPLPIAALAGVVFIARTGSAGQALLAAGHGPASHNAPATWFALNGVIAVLALGGVVATIMAAVGTTEPMPRRRQARLLTRYWITAGRELRGHRHRNVHPVTPVVACLVCGQPLDALLTSGLHAGVAVMALVAVLVVAAIGRGALRLLREDRAALEADPRGDRR